MSKVIINNPLEQFEIMKLLGMEGPLFGYIQIALTNFSVSIIIVAFFLISLHLLFAKGKPVGQGNPYSSLMESYFGLVLSIVRGQVGSKGMLYLPAAYSLFLFILGCNLLGLVPYSFCATAQFALTLSLSFTIIIGVTILGLNLHGIHFFSLFVPSGTPLGLVPLLVLIESISYLARTISLGVRLSANLISGHILLKIISTFTWDFIVSGSLLAFILAPLPILFLTLLFMLEFGVALLQGYVFVVLTLSYMADAIFLHDESANSSSHNSPPPEKAKGSPPQND
jgi:F-type H+-transporting ATPase subunit a